MQEVPPPCPYGARARGDVLALKLTQENYVRALAAMYYEGEHGARASAHTGGEHHGQPLHGGSSAEAAASMAAVQQQLLAHAASSCSLQPASTTSGPLGYGSNSSLVHTLSGSTTAAPALATAGTSSSAAAAAAVAVPAVAAHGAVTPNSACGSLCSSRDAMHGFSAAGSTAPLSSIAATDTSSGSLAAVPHRAQSGSAASALTHRGHMGRLAAVADCGEAQHCDGDNSAPLQLLGSGDATDEETPHPR